MTLETFKELKADLEHEMKIIIVDFEARTDTKIDSVNLSQATEAGSGKMRTVNVELEVKL